MTTKVDFISSQDYKLIEILDGDVDVVEEMLDQSGYLCDAISSVADSNVPIYNGEIWEGASSISEYIESAIEEGLAPVSSGDVDLMKIFQAGYFQYYTTLLYDNLDSIAFNFIAEKVNEFLNGLEDTSHLDIDEIEEAIEDTTDNTDNNDTFDDLADKANEIIERINNGEFGEVEEAEELL
jgi:hypothetical protein